jgi:hypothetical protein
LDEVYEARSGAIIEKKDNKETKLYCESCFSVPGVIYYCHFKDVNNKKRVYFRYECFECCEKIFKQPGYYNQFVDLLSIHSIERFPALIEEKNLLFFTDSYIYINFDLILPWKLLYG